MRSIICSFLILCSYHIALGQYFDSTVSTKFNQPIKVLNLGTFHMGETSDADKVDFDENDQKNIKAVHRIARAIAEFKPTVIIVETPPSYNASLQATYANYLKDSSIKFQNSSEINLLAFEVGRLAGASRIYGIDYKQGYNYQIAQFVKNGKDHETYFKYMQLLDSLQKKFIKEDLSVLEHLQITNDPLYLDMLMNINADILTHISSEGKFQGAEEASKFYHRNLVMYSNLNQIELKPSDRIFILMGATHTAFFNMWMQRSPKYNLENPYDYLK